jgi:hypothetical protein
MQESFFDHQNLGQCCGDVAEKETMLFNGNKE